MHSTLLRWPVVFLLWSLALPLAAQDQAGALLRELERQFQAGERGAALLRAERAAASQPGDSRLRFLYAVMLTDLGRASQAAQALEALTQEFPELPEPFNNLAVLRAAEGQLDTARQLLESALRADPGYATAHQNLGDVLVRLALRSFRQAAASGVSDAALARKLRLASELAGTPP